MIDTDLTGDQVGASRLAYAAVEAPDGFATANPEADVGVSIAPLPRCKRHRLCTRGPSHPGLCRLPKPKGKGRTPQTAVENAVGTSTVRPHSAKRARTLRLRELNSAHPPPTYTPFSAEEEARHQAARARRSASGKRVTFAPTPPPRSPPSTPEWSDEDDDSGAPQHAYGFQPKLFAEVNEAHIIDGTRRPRPIRSAQAPAPATMRSSAARSSAASRSQASMRPRGPEPSTRASLASTCSGVDDRTSGITSEVRSEPEHCERDPRCVRGFRHCGWGGRCSYRREFAPLTSMLQGRGSAENRRIAAAAAASPSLAGSLASVPALASSDPIAAAAAAAAMIEDDVEDA